MNTCSEFDDKVKSQTMQGAAQCEFTRTATPQSFAGYTYPALGGEVPDYQRRVIAEKQELDEKLKNLLVFIEYGYAKFGALTNEEQKRLRQQAEVMRQYSSILADRIALFGART
jgi:hypothetical protein